MKTPVCGASLPYQSHSTEIRFLSRIINGIRNFNIFFLKCCNVHCSKKLFIGISSLWNRVTIFKIFITILWRSIRTILVLAFFFETEVFRVERGKKKKKMVQLLHFIFSFLFFSEKAIFKHIFFNRFLCGYTIIESINVYLHA